MTGQRAGNTNRWLTRAGLGLGLLLSMQACSDDSSDREGTDNPTAGQGPLYLVATSFSTGDQTETYFTTTKSLDAGTQLNTTRGPKLLGGIVPLVHEGTVYAPDANRIARYRLNAQDELTKVDEFQVTGVTAIKSWHLWIVSATKGYIFDPAGLRLIVWNPSTMQLAGKEIDVKQIARPGFTPNLVLEHSGPSKRGDELLIPLAWNDQDENSRHASGVLILNTARDEVIAVDEDERCGESYATVEAPNGDVYFFAPDWSAAPHFVFDNHRPSCSLRVAAGQNGFDDAGLLDLSQLGNGSAAAGAMPDGKTGFFFTALNEALYDGGKNVNGAYWDVWHYDFATQKSQKAAGVPVWSGQLYYVNVAGDILVPYGMETPTGNRTTLQRFKADGPPESLLSFDANWYGVAKLR